MIWTRRFLARVRSVVLGAMGAVAPRPVAWIRLEGTPRDVMRSAIA
jgi:hypothetical protein